MWTAGYGELVPHEAEQEAIREMVALRAQGRPLRVIAAEMQAEVAHCAGNSVGWASFITGGGFHFPVRASLFGA